MRWSGEIFEGGSTRDELVLNPVYAASKPALSGLSMHLTREMRVGLTVMSFWPVAQI
jgi:short-subunit dehydrogenase